MFTVEFQTLSLNSGDTQTISFGSPVSNAEVALKKFSGNNVSCEVVGIYGSEVRVTASSDAGGSIEVLVIAVVPN